LRDAFREIYFLFASLADVLFVELIGKYLRLLSAVRTRAGKRLEVFKKLKTRAMQWRRHGILLFLLSSNNL
jgi:hypothetical protein